jgi:hypothetical protein
MEKTKFKKCDIVYWQDLQGEFIDKFHNSDYPIRVRFTNNRVVDFTNDGRCNVDTPPVLSHTPYTLNGFTQNEVIEKDTLVWVKHEKDGEWKMRYYSHFENGKHYCFRFQKSSKETQVIEIWNFVETTNPLIK